MTGSVRFLQPDGRAPPGGRAARSTSTATPRRGRRFDFAPLRGRAALSARAAAGRALARDACGCENDTAVPDGRRSTARRRCATRCSRPTGARAPPGGRFVSPLDAGERAVSGQHLPGARHRRGRRGAGRGDHAARPPADRPREPRRPVRRAPRSRRRCCCTCMVLSDDEREAIAEQDPAVRAMIERAERGHARGAAGACTGACAWRIPDGPGPPADPPACRTRCPARSASRSTASPFGRGDQGAAAPGAGRRPARPHAGRAAPRRSSGICVDYDDRVHLGVTIDDDPART